MITTVVLILKYSKAEVINDFSLFFILMKH